MKKKVRERLIVKKIKSSKDEAARLMNMLE